jgi:hypothetical protein
MKSLKFIYGEVPARRLLRPPVHVDFNLGTKQGKRTRTVEPVRRAEPGSGDPVQW